MPPLRSLMPPLLLTLAAAGLAAPAALAQAPAGKAAPPPAAKPAPMAADLLSLPAPSGTPSPAPSGTPSPATAQALADGCAQCGRVESIRQSTVKDSWTPLGTGVGVGGAAPVTGTGGGSTSISVGRSGVNPGLVVLGAAGGASYQKKPGAYERPRWEVTVRMDNGQTRVVSLAFEPYVHEGDRVRVSGNSVELLD
jgi:outer membrane lipoprotein SlyB